MLEIGHRLVLLPLEATPRKGKLMLASLLQSLNNKVLATSGATAESALLGAIAHGRLTTLKATNPVVLRVKVEMERKAQIIKIKMAEVIPVADRTLKDLPLEATPRNEADLEAETVARVLVVVLLVPKIAEDVNPRAQDEVNHRMETRKRHVFDTCRENARRRIVSIVTLLFATSL